MLCILDILVQSCDVLLYSVHCTFGTLTTVNKGNTFIHHNHDNNKNVHSGNTKMHNNNDNNKNNHNSNSTIQNRNLCSAPWPKMCSKLLHFCRLTAKSWCSWTSRLWKHSSRSGRQPKIFGVASLNIGVERNERIGNLSCAICLNY